MAKREADETDSTQAASDAEQGEAGATDAPTAVEENDAHSTILSADTLSGVQPQASDE